jgi:biotin transport system ATP-binding protein
MSPSCLAASELSLVFSSHPPALEKLTLDFEEGELTVIAGKNGSGKTVLAKCLAGLLQPTFGEVRFRGEAFSRLRGSLATRVAYVYQDARLQIIGDTVLDDVLFGLSAIGMKKEEAEQVACRALEEVGLGAKAGWIPQQLSGGEQRRLAIAALLALDPSVLILDEPFANLDWESVSSVLHILVALRKRGKTAIVLTHELDKILGLADRLVILDRGNVVASGRPETVMEGGIEMHGLRDPLRHGHSLRELTWLED